ncbi:putative lysozyme-like protein isoform X2 [Schistocerca americana]|uniref:putative lysozyme-like protein isoform X2 n=1 Tax=Schistocerca americana TaxID=7009 RepID=UPI001F4F955E|nr:putative lysozyme-like protein isoform X2 [Schistocerca americana]
MELKLLTVLALFAVCGIVQARQVAPDCDSICLHQREGSSARNVVRGKKHRASRSKGHLAPASRQHDYDFSTFCASCYGSETTGTLDRAISSRQSQSFPASIVSTAMQIPEEAMSGVFGGSGGSGSSFLSGFPNPFNIFSSGSGSSESGSGSTGGGSGSSGGGIFGLPAEMMNSITGGSGSSSLPFGVPNPLSIFSQGQSSSGGRGSSDSGSGSSGGGSGSSGGGSGSSGGGIFGLPAQMVNSVFSQMASSSLPFGVPNPMSIFSQGQSSGSGSGSSGSGSGSSGSESGSSGSGSGASGLFEIPEEFADAAFGTGQSGSQGGLTAENLVSRQGTLPQHVSYCQQACNFAVPSSKARRPEASGRKGASHGHKERHASRSTLPQHTAVQHTRQAGSSSSGICPTICQNLDSFLPGLGSSSQSSSSGSSAGSTGESGTSSQTSSDSQGGSTTGSEESSTSS